MAIKHSHPFALWGADFDPEGRNQFSCVLYQLFLCLSLSRFIIMFLTNKCLKTIHLLCFFNHLAICSNLYMMYKSIYGSPLILWILCLIHDFPSFTRHLFHFMSYPQTKCKKKRFQKARFEPRALRLEAQRSTN